MRIVSPTKTQSILLRPSVLAFLSKDKTSMMYARPWRKQIAFEDARFRRENRDDHPSYACRWAIHQLRQRSYIATMYWHHSGCTQAQIVRHTKRQNRVIDAKSAEAWRSVVWPAKEVRVAA